MITYGEYFKRRAAGETVKSIAESLGTTSRTLNRTLERVGYVSEGKGNNQRWIWLGDGSEPLEKEMLFGRTSAINRKNNIVVNRDTASNSESVVDNTNDGNDNSVGVDIFDSILHSPKKSNSKGYRGFYLSDETLAFLDKIESGRRSEFVDECIKKIARDKGLL